MSELTNDERSRIHRASMLSDSKLFKTMEDAIAERERAVVIAVLKSAAALAEASKSAEDAARHIRKIAETMERRP